MKEASSRIAQNYLPDFVYESPYDAKVYGSNRSSIFPGIIGRIEGEKILDTRVTFSNRQVESDGLDNHLTTLVVYESWVTKDEACWIQNHRIYARLRATCKYLYVKLNNEEALSLKQGLEITHRNRCAVLAKRNAHAAFFYYHLVTNGTHAAQQLPDYMKSHNNPKFDPLTEISFLVNVGNWARNPLKMIGPMMTYSSTMTDEVFHIFLTWVLDVIERYPEDSIVRKTPVIDLVTAEYSGRYETQVTLLAREDAGKVEPNLLKRAKAAGLFTLSK
jgi:hypothetical protein